MFYLIRYQYSHVAGQLNVVIGIVFDIYCCRENNKKEKYKVNCSMHECHEHLVLIYVNNTKFDQNIKTPS